MARVAGLAEACIGGLGRAGITLRGRCLKRLRRALEILELGVEVGGLLPDLRLGAGLAELGSRPGREPVRRLAREIGDLARGGPDGRHVRRVAGQFAAKVPVGLADGLHSLMSIVHDLERRVLGQRFGDSDRRHEGDGGNGNYKLHTNSYSGFRQLSSIILISAEKSLGPPPRLTKRW